MFLWEMGWWKTKWMLEWGAGLQGWSRSEPLIPGECAQQITLFLGHFQAHCRLQGFNLWNHFWCGFGEILVLCKWLHRKPKFRQGVLTPLQYLDHFSFPTVEQVALSQLHVSLRPRPASHNPCAAAAVGHEPGPVPQNGVRSGEKPGQQPGGGYTPVAHCNPAKVRICAFDRSPQGRPSLERWP